MARSRWLAVGCLVVGCTLGACGDSAPTETATSEEAETSTLDRRVVLENATLNQNDDAGQLLWQVSAARVAYSQDRQQAELETLTGNLYDAGELVLQLRARQGTILRDGKEIVMRGDIEAVDPRNEAVLRAREARWFPEQNLLTVRDDLTGNHPDLDITAREGRYDAAAQQLELSGDIVAVAKEPSLLLETEALVWSVPEARIRGDRPLQIDRFAGDTTTDRVVADRADVDLEAETATLTGNVELRSVEPPIQVASESATWRIEARVVETAEPVRVRHTAAGIDITGNSGRLNLAESVATLAGGIEGRSSTNQAELYADRLEWNLTTQGVEATGNVRYQQQDPPLISQGDRATGNLRSREIAVRGGSDGGVISEVKF